MPRGGDGGGGRAVGNNQHRGNEAPTELQGNANT